MSFARCLAVLLTLFTSCAAAAEGAAASQFYYARDDRKEIAFSLGEAGGVSFEFRGFGDVREGRVVYHGGEFAKSGDGALRYEAETEGKHTALTITGKLGDETLRVEATGIERLGGGVADVSGSYRKLAAAGILDRVRSRFEAADAALNADYQSVRASLDVKQKTELRDAQRDWIAVRDQHAVWETHGAENAKTIPAYWDELLSQTVTRIGFLKVYTGKGVPPGLSGEYGDFSGGSLRLELGKAGLRFSLDVVRGPSLHLGEISGLARRKNDRLFEYRETVPKDEQSPDRLPAELTFSVVDGHRVRIAGKNTGAHHGARAYFDGIYFKTGALRKPIAAE